MAKKLYRISFPKATPRSQVEHAMGEAFFAAECIHGQSRVRLGAGFYLAPGRSQCLIDTSTDVGEQIARVFTGLLSRKLGEEAIRIERVVA